MPLDYAERLGTRLRRLGREKLSPRAVASGIGRLGHIRTEQSEFNFFNTPRTAVATHGHSCFSNLFLLIYFSSMESRKRPRVDDGDVLHSKKRVVSDSHDSPMPVNGVSEAEEPKDGDSLEVNKDNRQSRYALSEDGLDVPKRCHLQEDEALFERE